MPIYEIEPRFRWGHIGLGSKLGRVIREGRINISGGYDELTGEDHGVFATPKGPDTLVLTGWCDDRGGAVFGYSQTDMGELTREEINHHSLLCGKLRWVPEKWDHPYRRLI